MNTVKIQYGKEDLISRVPGLFPYMEYDEFGICHLHKSSDSDSGCYGKMVPSLLLPSGVSLVVDNEQILKENTVYSYRTLINYYYKYKTLTNSSFIDFFRKGIGEFKIDIADESWELVPEVEYYANAARIYEEYSRIKKACDNYIIMKPISGKNCNMECLVEKYRRMGGDVMMQFYYNRFIESQEKSDYYFQFGVPEETYFNVNLLFVTNYSDLGIVSTYEIEWKPGEEYKVGDIVIYEDRSYICIENNNGYWDNSIEEFVFPYFGPNNPINKFELIGGDITQVELEGESDSKLKSFRNNRTYTSIDGLKKEPEDNEDWTWFYKVGTIGYYESVTDEYGNIAITNDNRGTIGTVQTNLLAYGNILTDISVDTQERTISFSYVIGCNLKARLKDRTVIDNNNANSGYRYYYDNFQYNEIDTEHGVRFIETYSYEEGSELDIFVTQNYSLFEYYIGKTTGNRDDELAVYNEDMGTSYAYAKCAFSVAENKRSAVALVNGNEFMYQYINAPYSVSVKSSSDILSVPLFKDELYVGITYEPKIDVNIGIDRGNAASWERHIKLGEVKSFDDLANYANGGFFNIR